MAVTQQKQAVVAQMKETLSEAKGAVLVGYSGLTVAQVTDLRRKFLAEGVEYKVIKNTLTRIAANELGYEAFSEHLEGPTALATSSTDAVAPARILENFIKDTKTEALTVKAGIVEGEVLDAAKVQENCKLAEPRRYAFHASFRASSSSSQCSLRSKSCCGSKRRNCCIIATQLTKKTYIKNGGYQSWH